MKSDNNNSCENIIVLGSGGREYAIIKKLKEDSKKINKSINIICLETNKNDGLLKYAEVVIYTNLRNMIEKLICKYKEILFAIIGPENFLKEGISDLFNKHNIPCIGPNKYYSKLETSKSFCRDFLNRYDDLREYSNNYKTINYLELKPYLEEYKNEIVIKQDGLYRGKGVFVENVDFIRTNINDLCIDDHNILVIEDKLYGEEYSLMSVVDINGNISHFPPIKDYKRLYNDNMGCNTGGMGCIIDSNNTLIFLSQEDIELSRQINERVIGHINGEYENKNYVGILYGSFMKTKDGSIKIIEYNCRFGDPECILALNLLKTNFYKICVDIIRGTLNYKLEFSNEASICVYLVPKSYCCNNMSDKYDIYFNKNLNKNNLIYSNAEIHNNHIYSIGSRCLALCINKPTLYECYHYIYKELLNINGYLHYRTDIGAEYLSKYEVGGVSINLAEQSLKQIKNEIISTYNKNVISEYGSFGGEFKLENNILVSSIDGVGTKSVLAKKIYGTNAFINLGRDIVAHSINDILVQGATPLFFLDYFGTDSLNTMELVKFIEGVADYCKKYGNIPILGGETAEMPIVYKSDMTDLVGCIIGTKNNSFFKHKIHSGDIILNIPSLGPHTNGFTLLNKIFENSDSNKFIEELLTPHRCYLNEIYEFVDTFGYDSIHGMCHITGGGIHGNMARIIKPDVSYKLYDTIVPNWCKIVMKLGGIDLDEMLKVFNCGYGFILIVPSNILNETNKLSYNIEHIGYIQ